MKSIFTIKYQVPLRALFEEDKDEIEVSEMVSSSNLIDVIEVARELAGKRKWKVLGIYQSYLAGVK